IDKAEALYVINIDGYIGSSVNLEIGYALGKNKPVYFSEKAGNVDLNCIVKDIIPIDAIKNFANKL
ncbi:MAG: hypothetical protein PHU12_01405, partial [Candidatus Aenigmarchaeota archaeon]|nr:hypothetical protein [Candidatus Aenigmarchaeota archaeon]